MFTLAHYWGIDEIGVFVVPVVIALVALRWAEKRARAKAQEARPEDEDSVEEDQIDAG
jgi:mannose/fructose/N-acetylgalactosamine-specific phosphotransferase system component IIC